MMGGQRLRRAVLLVAASLVWAPILYGGREPPLIRLPGYAAVPFSYGGMNRMVVNATINGRKAHLIVDTGASFSVFDASRANRFGIGRVAANSPFGQFKTLNNHRYPIGYINSLQAGDMDFGGGPIALFEASTVSLSEHNAIANLDVDGILGADVLTRYKAVINCRTRYIFFPTSSGHHNIAQVALSQHFTRIPMREEATRGFTVPASLNGRATRLLVDTGAFVSTFDANAIKGAGTNLQLTRLQAQFSDGVSRRISVGQISQLMVGDFHVPPQKLAVTVLPNFALEHGKAHVDGILGMELLAFNFALIDFGSMSLFLH